MGKLKNQKIELYAERKPVESRTRVYPFDTDSLPDIRHGEWDISYILYLEVRIGHSPIIAIDGFYPCHVRLPEGSFIEVLGLFIAVISLVRDPWHSDNQTWLVGKPRTLLCSFDVVCPSSQGAFSINPDQERWTFQRWDSIGMKHQVLTCSPVNRWTARFWDVVWVNHTVRPHLRPHRRWFMMIII